MDAPQKNELYTYADYCSWNDDQRWEIIDGIAYAMVPAPSWTHQALLGSLYIQFGNFLKGKACRVFTAPLDVRLDADEGDNTVVQPDLMVVCDRSKMDAHGIKGAPDMVVEILSPSTASKDRIVKLSAYRRAGVREYWIVDPDDKSISAYTLKGGEYVVNAYAGDEIIPVHVLEGLSIRLQDVFEEW